jgi:hypothetical protein
MGANTPFTPALAKAMSSCPNSSTVSSMGLRTDSGTVTSQ